jgi:methionyl-tRNA synthetase
MHVAIWFEAIWNCFTGLTVCFDCDLEGVIEKLTEQEFKLVPFMGQDTEFCYTIGLSCVLLGLGYDQVQDQLSIQKFVKLDGMKFSSSRNHVIFLEELAEEVPVDVIRLYSLSILRPYLEDNNNFEVAELKRLNGRVRVLEGRVAEHVKGSPRETPRSLSSEDSRQLLQGYRSSMDALDFRGAYLGIMKLMDSITAQAECPRWYEDLSCLLLMLKPVMPSLSTEMGTQLFGGTWSEVDFEWLDRES